MTDKISLRLEERRVPVTSKLGFSVGAGADGLHNIAVNALLLFYYQQILGLPGTLGGTALLIAMIFDAVTDPVVGALSDRLRQGRWGRRHPLMFLSAAPLATCFIALFSPPEGLTEFQLFAWLTTFAVLVRASLTLYNIPHLALGAEMARRYDDRTSVFAYSTLAGFLMGVLGYALVLRVYFPETVEFSPGTLNQAGYTPFALAVGLTMGFLILLCAFGTRREIPFLPREERPAHELEARAALRDLGAVLRNRSFQAIFLGLIMAALVSNVEEVLNTYMSLHFWALGTERLAALTPALLAGLPGAALLCWLLPRVIDKRNTLMLALAGTTFCVAFPIVARLVGLPWMPANGTTELFWTLFVFRAGLGVFGPATLILINSTFADICDEIALETGRRLEGLVYATRTFALKLVSGLGNFLGGVILDLIEFPQRAETGTVAPEVIFQLGLVVGPIGGACALLGLVFYSGYRIDRVRHGEILAELDRRKASTEADVA